MTNKKHKKFEMCNGFCDDPHCSYCKSDDYQIDWEDERMVFGS